MGSNRASLEPCLAGWGPVYECELLPVMRTNWVVQGDREVVEVQCGMHVEGAHTGSLKCSDGAHEGEEVQFEVVGDDGGKRV